jgi:hypothetical protein
VAAAEEVRLEEVDGLVVVLREVGEPPVLDGEEEGEGGGREDGRREVPAPVRQDDWNVMIVSVP